MEVVSGIVYKKFNAVYAVVLLLSALMAVTVVRNALSSSSATECHSTLIIKQNAPRSISSNVSHYRNNAPYVPSVAERFVLDHAKELGYHYLNKTQIQPTCDLWKIGSKYPNLSSLDQYREELQIYKALVKNFAGISDLRKLLREGRSHDEVCRQVKLHPDGLDAIFPSGLLSSGRFGKIEPLLPPLRHPEFCFNTRLSLDLNYLVHDFVAMCRQLTANSCIILIDMGASLLYHHAKDSPAVYLTNLYQQFGFHFDHIYAFEVRKTEPNAVFERLPEQLIPAYHWINVGVSADPLNAMNPFKILLNEYTEEDFVVVKLDIDTPSIEIPLAHQLLNDTRLHKLVDQFYFEHHVLLQDLIGAWSPGTRQGLDESVESSLKLFQGMREMGVASHSWV